VAAGGNVSITQVVRNLALAPGTAPASISGLAFGPMGGPLTALGQVNIPSIAAGGTATATKSVQIPPATAPGLYVIAATADITGAIVEANEGNNTATAVARLIVGPDITVTAATTAAGAAVGMNVSVSYTLKNQGGAAAGPFAVGFALVPTSDLSGASDIPLAAVRNGVVLAAGASLALVNAVTVPANTVPGQYRIRVIADNGNAVVEADETNNTLLTGVVNIAAPI